VKAGWALTTYEARKQREKPISWKYVFCIEV